MKKLYLLIPLFVLLFGCQSTQTVPKSSSLAPATSVDDGLIDYSSLAQATDPEYGRSANNPINTGGFRTRIHRNQYEFLGKITGPNGEAVEASRIGSCCPFSTPEGIEGYGMLDVWSINYQGLKEPLKFYLNSYSSGGLQIPVGLRLNLENDGRSNNTIRHSFNETVIEQYQAIKYEDGISDDEAITLAQFYVITVLGRSAEYDLPHAAIDPEPKEDGKKYVIINKRDQTNQITLYTDKSLSEEDEKLSMMTQLILQAPFIHIIVDDKGKASSLLDMINDKK